VDFKEMDIMNRRPRMGNLDVSFQPKSGSKKKEKERRDGKRVLVSLCAKLFPVNFHNSVHAKALVQYFLDPRAFCAHAFIFIKTFAGLGQRNIFDQLIFSTPNIYVQ